MEENADVEFGKQLGDRLLRSSALKFALDMAKDASFVLTILELARTREFGRFPPPPPVHEWLKLYRDHRRLGNDLGVGLGLPASGHGSLSWWADMFRAFPKMASEEQAKIISQIDARVLLDCIYVIAGDPAKVESKAVKDALEVKSLQDLIQIEKVVHLPGVQFLVRVWLPCVIEYQEYPGTLFGRARRGDLDALEKLLRLDKAVVSEPRIAEELHQAWNKPITALFQRLGRAIAGKPNGRLTKMKVKGRLASLISQMTRRLGHGMNEPQIRAAFDAAAKEMGHLRDRELPDSSEAFSKAIQRDRDGWRLGQKS